MARTGVEDDIQKQRTRVLKSRNMDPLSSAAAPPTQRNLLTAGTARLLGNEEATLQAVKRASQTFDFTSHTSSDIMTLCLQQKALDARQHRAHTASQPSRLTKEDLSEIYNRTKQLRANVAFGSGNGQLGKALSEEVRRRTLSKVQQTTKKLEHIKKWLRLLVKRAATIRKAEKNYKKWKNVNLKDMI